MDNGTLFLLTGCADSTLRQPGYAHTFCHRTGTKLPGKEEAGRVRAEAIELLGLL